MDKEWASKSIKKSKVMGAILITSAALKTGTTILESQNEPVYIKDDL